MGVSKLVCPHPNLPHTSEGREIRRHFGNET